MRLESERAPAGRKNRLVWRGRPRPRKARCFSATCTWADTPIKTVVASVETYLVRYLHELHEIRSSGEATGETSYYPPLSELLDSVGSELKRKIRCIFILKDSGAGHPDGGLFTKDQFQKLKDSQPLAGQKPRSGARLQPTAQAVGREWGVRKPRSGERIEPMTQAVGAIGNEKSPSGAKRIVCPGHRAGNVGQRTA